MLLHVSADNTYLTNELSQEERKSLFSSDEDAMQRGNHYNSQVTDFIKQIEYLHDVGNLDPHKILDFYLIPQSEQETTSEEKQELLEYIENVISRKNNPG